MIPNEPTLANVAQQIVEGRATDNLHFWIVFIVLAALTGLVVWFIAPYLGERGKLLAMAETLERRLEEIRQSTDASERIKSEIAHSEWSLKEYKTLQRNKLEQLLAAAYKVLLATEVHARFRNENEKVNIASKEFVIDVRQISALYFSGFEAEVHAIMLAHDNFVTWIVQSRSEEQQQQWRVDSEKDELERIRVAPDRVLDGVTFDVQLAKWDGETNKLFDLQQSHLDEYPKFHLPLRKAIDNLQASASALMNELTAPTER